MRYVCPACGKLVKDKFILGLLHFCEPGPSAFVYHYGLPYQQEALHRYHEQGVQATPEEFDLMMKDGLTPTERRVARGAGQPDETDGTWTVGSWRPGD